MQRMRRELLQVTELFYILIAVVVTQVYTFVIQLILEIGACNLM